MYVCAHLFSLCFNQTAAPAEPSRTESDIGLRGHHDVIVLPAPPHGKRGSLKNRRDPEDGLRRQPELPGKDVRSWGRGPHVEQRT